MGNSVCAYSEGATSLGEGRRPLFAQSFSVRNFQTRNKSGDQTQNTSFLHETIKTYSCFNGTEFKPFKTASLRDAHDLDEAEAQGVSRGTGAGPGSRESPLDWNRQGGADRLDWRVCNGWQGLETRGLKE